MGSVCPRVKKREVNLGGVLGDLIIELRGAGYVCGRKGEEGRRGVLVPKADVVRAEGPAVVAGIKVIEEGQDTPA